MLACNCLNVIIDSESSDIQKVTIDLLDLTEEERKDQFFKQDIGKINKLGRINKEHAGLVASRIVGAWIVHQCISCELHTHAIHKEKGAGLVLVSTKLLIGADQISELRGTNFYSNAFQIIVTPTQVDYGLANVDKVHGLNADIKLALAGLQQRFREVIKGEVAATEDRVRQFTEQQYVALENLRSRIHSEHQALMGLILNNRTKFQQTEKTLEDSPQQVMPSSPISKKPNVSQAENVKPILIKPKSHLITNITPKSKKRTQRQMSHPLQHSDSYDAEGLFQLDGMEECSAISQSDLDDSDIEESNRDDGIHIPRQRIQPSNLAKSLPMNIPIFMSPFNTHSHEERDEVELSRGEDSLDIAKSIQALARSVHGDTVFGDLPRPRFSTEI